MPSVQYMHMGGTRKCTSHVPPNVSSASVPSRASHCRFFLRRTRRHLGNSPPPPPPLSTSAGSCADAALPARLLVEAASGAVGDTSEAAAGSFSLTGSAAWSSDDGAAASTSGDGPRPSASLGLAEMKPARGSGIREWRMHAHMSLPTSLLSQRTATCERKNGQGCGGGRFCPRCFSVTRAQA